MKKGKAYNKFTMKMQKKLVVLYMLVLLAFAGLFYQLYAITKDNGERYKKQVLSQQRYDSTTLPYKRGSILDANGSVLASSEKVYNV
ncbi:MAG: cell division protein FtsI, partial [Lachnospiraceae bacterium]|nr:cell division protein FtsI [Lachnospiraceae bacterium]